MGDAAGGGTGAAGETGAADGKGSASASPMVRPGGIILADNVLWYGKVVGLKPGEGERPSDRWLKPTAMRQEEFSSDRGLKASELAAKADGNILKSSDKHTAGIIEFNRMVAQDPRVENVILPLRDGINLIRVK
jgi:predicted O-methyltransferase YrrM